MIDLLADIETYLSSQISDTPRKFYRDTMSDDPAEAIGIYEYAGQSGPAQIAGELRSIQIVSRASTVKEAKAMANRLYKALKTEDSILDLTPERWSMIHLRQPPFKFKVDDQGRSYYAFNMGVTTYHD